MERRYLVGLTAGERVDAALALRAKEMRASRTGEAYLSLEFGDRSGAIGGIMFRPAREAESIPIGTVVHVRGTATTYRGVLRVSVESMRPAVNYDLREIMPAGPRDVDEMLDELRAHVRAIGDRGLGLLVRAIFADREFMKRFKVCPATRSHHHAYVGGLLEHTVAVAGICRTMADFHPHIDADLLLAGALLHDIGVVDTLEFQASIERTDQGRLLGAAVLGVRRLMASAPGAAMVSPQTVDQLAHMLLVSEGGSGDQGSARSCTLEGTVLSGVHALDAESARFIAAGQRAGTVGEAWTGEGARVLPPRAVPPVELAARSAVSQYARSA